MAPPDPSKMAEQLLTKADTDGDGMLSAAELMAYFQERQARRPMGREKGSPMPTELQTATAAMEPQADAETLAEDPKTTGSATVSDILDAGLTANVAETSSTEPAATETLDPADMQDQVLTWLTGITQDTRFAELPEEQQQQIQEAAQAVSALDPADPGFSDSLQTLLQTYGLAE